MAEEAVVPALGEMPVGEACVVLWETATGLLSGGVGRPSLAVLEELAALVFVEGGLGVAFVAFLEEDFFLLCLEGAPVTVVVVVEGPIRVEEAVEVLDADVELESPVALTLTEGMEGAVVTVDLDGGVRTEGDFVFPAQEIPVALDDGLTVVVLEEERDLVL